MRRRFNFKLMGLVAGIWLVVGGMLALGYSVERDKRERAEAEARAAQTFAESPLGREIFARQARQYSEQVAAYNRAAAAAMEQVQRQIQPVQSPLPSVAPIESEPDSRGRDCYVRGHYRRGSWVDGYYRRCR